MSGDHVEPAHPTADESVRTLLLLMPRIIARIKRTPVPAELQTFSLAPRHLSLLAYLLFDGPMVISDLAGRLEVMPATVSLMVGDLSRRGVVTRREDEADRRRIIVSISDDHRAAVDAWLSRGSEAWRKALGPLTHEQRRTVVEALRTYERELTGGEED